MPHWPDLHHGAAGLDELTVVETLHERKALMHVKSDVFLAMPGSVGTLDELFEAVTWRERRTRTRSLTATHPAPSSGVPIVSLARVA